MDICLISIALLSSARSLHDAKAIGEVLMRCQLLAYAPDSRTFQRKWRLQGLL